MSTCVPTASIPTQQIYSHNNGKAGVDTFLANVTATMENVYVNLIGTFALSNVARVQRANLECAIIHKIVDECGCTYTPPWRWW
jgi:hypothetical protein